MYVPITTQSAQQQSIEYDAPVEDTEEAATSVCISVCELTSSAIRLGRGTLMKPAEQSADTLPGD